MDYDYLAQSLAALLRYSDKTVSQISGYLGFSSHGHVSGVFKNMLV